MNHVLLVRSRTLAGCSGARLHTTVHSRPHFTAPPVGSDRTIPFRACARGIPMIAPDHTRCPTVCLACALAHARARLMSCMRTRTRARARVRWHDAHLKRVGRKRALRRERRVVVRRCGRRLGDEVEVAWNDERVDRQFDRGDTRVVVHRARRLGPAHGAGAVAPATARMWRSVRALWVQRA